MRTFYLYRPDANRFAGIGFSIADDERVVDVHFTDTPLISQWQVPTAHGFEDNPEVQGDFPSLSNYWKIPVLSQRALNVLRPLLGNSYEILPINHPSGDPFAIVHIMDTIDCLDCDKSELTRDENVGRVSQIHRYALKEEMLSGKHIFKLPLECGADLIVDDDFRRAVEASGLKGLKFKELLTTHRG